MNKDEKTVEGFGFEWNHFDQSMTDQSELFSVFNSYFAVFPWGDLPEGAEGFDLGCGSGRWAKFVAPRVGLIHCLDASSEALESAKRNLAGVSNVTFHHSSVDSIPFADGTMDFGYSLGVLHHVPDTCAGLRSCVQKLKAGAPFLLYLYYAFDNRPKWFYATWKLSNLIRRGIAPLPNRPKLFLTEVIATLVYWPLARLALVLERLGCKVDSLPLSAYRDKSFYTMRTDSFDRFGTRLEQRFTKSEIEKMMTSAGLERILFHQGEPYYCAVGFRSS